MTDHCRSDTNELRKTSTDQRIEFTVPKPSPFPDEARRQFAELRDSVDRLQAHFRVTLDRLAIQARNPDRDNLRRYVGRMTARFYPGVEELAGCKAAA